MFPLLARGLALTSHTMVLRSSEHHSCCRFPFHPLGGLTLIIYLIPQVFDWLLTLDLEVPLVWGSPRSGTKLLFILTRYLAFIDVSLIIYCKLYNSHNPRVWTCLQINLVTHFLPTFVHRFIKRSLVSRPLTNALTSYIGLLD